MESPNRRSDFTHRRRISHCCICNTALFSTQSKILPAQRVDFTEKSTLSRAFFMAGEEGFEPSAYGFGDRRSTS